MAVRRQIDSQGQPTGATRSRHVHVSTSTVGSVGPLGAVAGSPHGGCWSRCHACALLSAATEHSPGDSPLHVLALSAILSSGMTSPCSCLDLRCADPEHQLPASDEEQVLMVVEIGLVAAMLDDAIPQGESEALVTSIRLLPGLRNLSDIQVNLILSRAGERTREGDEWLCEVAGRLTNPGLRRVAFRMASMFCSWDGVINDKEQGYLNFLAKAFGLSHGEADALFAEATGQRGTASVMPPPMDQP